MNTSGKIDKTKDLGFLGVNYQVMLVRYFIETPNYFVKLQKIIDQNMFTEDNLRLIVGLMKERYEKEQTVATYKDINIMIRNTVSTEINMSRALAMLDNIANTEFAGLDLITDNAERFFKQQMTIKLSAKLNDIVKRGDLDDVESSIDIFREGLAMELEDDLGAPPLVGLDDILSEDYRETIPTGADRLDEALNGGIGLGELGVIIAPTGVGKTSSLCGFSSYASSYKCEQNNYSGYKVLHIFFEDSVRLIKRKYCAYITNIEQELLGKTEYKESVKELLINGPLTEVNNMINNNVRIIRARNGEFSASDVGQLIGRERSMGFNPSLVMVDYFECLKPEPLRSKSDSEWTQEGITMRKLEAISNEYNVAMWVPIQGGKNSINQDFIGMEMGGGSVKKSQIAHIVIGFGRTMEQRTKNLMNIQINKFRGGAISVSNFANVTLNNGTGRFDFATCDQVDDAIDGTKTKSNENMKDVRNLWNGQSKDIPFSA